MARNAVQSVLTAVRELLHFKEITRRVIVARVTFDKFEDVRSAVCRAWLCQRTRRAAAR